MEPTINDVLSGRGAWFNQHPGNEHFRRMLEEKKAVYMTGTKKQKMDMSKAIVESIYSMEPPGRFLKQCPGEAGQWKELSKREAADKAAQAMAYAIKGDSLKEKRRERRRSRLPPSLRLQQDDVVEKSSQSDGQPTNNHSEGVRSSSVARHGVAAASTYNDAESAVNDEHADLVANGMLLSDNSNLSQQLQQFLQLSSTTTLPTSSGASLNANQTGLVQVLAHALQQLQQQLLPLQYALGQDSLGLQTQTPLRPALGTQNPLQPALLEGLTQLLSQTQQQQEQNEQQQLLLQRLLNHQTVLPSGSLPPPPTFLSLFTTSPFLFQGALLPNDFFRGTCLNYSAGSQYEPAHNKILQNQKEHNALLLSVLRNQPSIGTSIAPQQAPQLYDQLQRSLVQQQQQLLGSSLVASNQLHHHQQQQQQQQQQQSLPLDPFHQARQTALLRRQKENSHCPPPINAQPSGNAAALSSREEESEAEEQSGSG